MSLAKQAVPVIAAAVISTALFGSIVLMTPEALQAAYPAPDQPTVYSADHARAQATAPDEERAPTF
jgi:hypothetical protein